MKTHFHITFISETYVDWKHATKRKPIEAQEDSNIPNSTQEDSVPSSSKRSKPSPNRNAQIHK